MAYINLRKASNQSNEKIDITFDLEVLKITAKKNIVVELDLDGYLFTNIQLSVGEVIYWRNGDSSPLVVGTDGLVLEGREAGLSYQGPDGKVIELLPPHQPKQHSFHTYDMGVWCSERISR